MACSSKHDGEVLATVDLTADEAGNFADTASADICAPAVDSAGNTALLTEDVTVIALTVADPAKGDTLVCVAYTRTARS